MPLFRRSKTPAIQVDPTLGNPAAAAALDAAARSWTDLAAVVPGAADYDVRELCVTVVTEQPHTPPSLDAWIEAGPDDPLAWTFHSARSIHVGWQIRGGAMEVEPSAWAEFQQHLDTAETSLARAIELEPTDPTPHVYRLLAARGLELDQAEVRLRFDAVAEIAPTHRFAHNQMVQSLTPRWGGSNDGLFEFVRSRTSTAPDGSGIHALLAEAHLERWFSDLLGGGSEVADRYWTRPGVREELEDAAARSVLHPDYGNPPRAAWDVQWFALVFWRTGQHDLARRLFERNGDTISEFPWGFLGNPVTKFLQARSDVGAAL